MSVSNTGDIGCVESTMDIVLERLRAELAALRADAERYRWLRDKYTVSLLNGEHELRITYGPRASTKSGIDDIIDATRGGHMTRPRAALGELRDEAARRWQA